MTSQSAERIGGWLLAPLAWLLLALLSASLSLLFFANALMSPQTWALLRAMSNPTLNLLSPVSFYSIISGFFSFQVP